MLGQNTTRQTRRKIYLNIKDGAVVKRTETGEETYSYVAGRVEAISQRERTFRNEVVVYWYIDLRDDESGELYSIGFPYGSNTFKSIILALASDEGLHATGKGLGIRIEPYKKNGYDKISVYVGDKRLDWVKKALPPITEAMVGGKRVKDDSARMEFISSLVNSINDSLPILVNR